MTRFKDAIKKTLPILVALLSFTFVVQATEVPKLTGRVNDYANILTPEQKQELETTLKGFEEKTTNQLVVLTINSIDETIEDFGIKVGDAWKIGQKSKNNGLILIVAVSNRAVRLEVGYGLEERITDAFSKLVIYNNIIPYFRDGNYYGGIKSGIETIINRLGLSEEDFTAAITAERKASADGAYAVLSPLMGFFLGIFFVLMMFASKKLVKSEKLGGLKVGIIIVLSIAFLILIAGFIVGIGAGDIGQFLAGMFAPASLLSGGSGGLILALFFWIASKGGGSSGGSYSSSGYSSSSGSYSSYSSSSDSFSGGGGSFGGGGASGSW